MIKITEEYSEQNKNELQRVKVAIDNKHELTFDNYPIVIMSKHFEYIEYESQKKQSHGTDENEHKNIGVLDKAKEKALELKDSVVDNTRQLADNPNN